MRACVTTPVMQTSMRSPVLSSSSARPRTTWDLIRHLRPRLCRAERVRERAILTAGRSSMLQGNGRQGNGRCDDHWNEAETPVRLPPPPRHHHHPSWPPSLPHHLHDHSISLFEEFRFARQVFIVACVIDRLQNGGGRVTRRKRRQCVIPGSAVVAHACCHATHSHLHPLSYPP